MKPDQVDVTSELNRLLLQYGCSPTQGGVTRLAIVLALKCGELPKLDYTPGHSDVFDEHTLAVLAEASAEKKRNQSKEALAVLGHLQAFGGKAASRFSSPNALRVVLNRSTQYIAGFFADPRKLPSSWRLDRAARRRATRRAIARPDWVDEPLDDGEPRDDDKPRKKDDETLTTRESVNWFRNIEGRDKPRPPRMTAMRPAGEISAFEALELLPSKALGQSRLDEWWVGKLSRQMAALTPSRSGIFDLAAATHLNEKTRLLAISIVQDEMDHPEGPPRKGSALAPVRLMTERQDVIPLPTLEGSVLHKSTSLEIVPPSRCMLSGDAWAWIGILDDDTRIEARGTFGSGAESDILVGELTIKPPRNRSLRQPIRCVRRPVGPTEV